MARPIAAVHRTILVVDVAGFSDHRRTNADQIAVRAGLYRALRQAFRRSGICWEDCEYEDRGDGVLILAPAEMAKAPFIEELPSRLVTALCTHNQAHRAERQIRLRMALHAGEVNFDDHGVTSTAINLTFRLLEAGPLKVALANSAGVAAVITSAWFFDEVVRHSTVCDATLYRPISVEVKETSTSAWIRVLGSQIPVHSVAPSLLLGRDQEQAMLHHAAMNARRGRFTIAWVTGEPGIGKSALSEAIGRRLAGDGWTVVWGSCLEPDGRSAGRPWTAMVTELASRFPPNSEQIAELAPVLSGYPTRSAMGDVTAARHRLRSAISGYLHAVTRVAPLLVVLDDLHHADHESLRLLAYLADDLVARRVFVVGTYSSGETNEYLNDSLAVLARHEPAHVDLVGLDRNTVNALIRQLCNRALAESTVSAIVGRTGGNPFFVRELARLLGTDGEHAAIVDVPPGVRHTVRYRVAQLPQSTQLVLRHASVIGRDFSLQVLSAITHLDENALIENVDAALQAGLLVERHLGVRSLRFAHALVSDTLYYDLSRLRRAAIHARIGAVLEHLNPGNITELAFHFNAAQTPDTAGKAAYYLRLAAQHAEGRYAHRKAAVLWQQAVHAHARSSIGTVRERLELIVETIRALVKAGDHGSAKDLRDDALAEAVGEGDAALTARVIVTYDAQGLWQHHPYGEADEKIIDMIDQTLQSLPHQHERLRCRLLASLASELEQSDDPRGDPASLEAVMTARRLGDPALLATALNARFRQSYWTSTLTEREQIATELLTLGKKHGLVAVEAVGRQALLRCACGRGQFTAAADHAAESERLAAAYDLPSVAVTASWFHGLQHTISGRYDEAVKAYGQAAELTRRAGMNKLEEGLTIVTSLSLAVWTGRLADLVDMLYRVYTRWPTPGTEAYALALAAAGRREEARAVAARCSPVPRDIMYKFVMALRGLVGIALNDRNRITEAYRALLPLDDEMAGGDTGGFVVLVPVAQLLGDLATHLGDTQVAHAHYLKARQIAERTKVAPWITASREALARTIERSRPRRVW